MRLLKTLVIYQWRSIICIQEANKTVILARCMIVNSVTQNVKVTEITVAACNWCVVQALRGFEYA